MQAIIFILFAFSKSIFLTVLLGMEEGSGSWKFQSLQVL